MYVWIVKASSFGELHFILKSLNTTGKVYDWIKMGRLAAGVCRLSLSLHSGSGGIFLTPWAFTGLRFSCFSLLFPFSTTTFEYLRVRLLTATVRQRIMGIWERRISKKDVALVGAATQEDAVDEEKGHMVHRDRRTVPRHPCTRGDPCPPSTVSTPPRGV